MDKHPVTEPLLAVAAGHHEAAYELSIIAGPDVGRAVTLDRSPIMVGSDASCDLVLSDATVSRQHFSLVRDANGFRLVDQGSTNGTRVDRTKVREAYLNPGQIIAAGRSMLRFGLAVAAGKVSPSPRSSFGELLGESRAMREVFTLLERAARTDATVLLLGETGTGKELAARAIHAASPRAARPLVVFDAASVPGSLIESELFGHEKGAFTGAVSQRAGLVEAADGGTLFLDEIGELPLDLQPRLLRAIEARQVRRVGSDHFRQVNIRLVAATNRDLQAEIAAGRFRQDLYWRLSVLEIRIPPLRQRPEDILALTNAFVAKVGGQPPAPEVLDALCSHDWPGNVRELKNVLERALALSTAGVFGAEFLQSCIRDIESGTGRQ